MDIRSLKPAKEFAQCYGGIYCIGNIVNNKVYIGSAINIKSRLRNHKKYLTANRHPNKHLQAAWNNCAIDFEFYILEIVSDNNKLLEREQHYIDLYKCYDNSKGYNKRLKANSNLGLKLHSEEQKKALSERMKGHSYNKGKITSEETKRKLSLANKGRKQSKEHIEKRMIFKRGVPVSEEQKLKISNTLKGNKCALGHKVSESSKLTMNIKKRKFDKWPHKLGSLCKCEECKLKLRLIRSQKYKDAKHAAI